MSNENQTTTNEVICANQDEKMRYLKSFIGEKITIYCCRYIYSGVIEGIDDFCVKIDGAQLVYDTGPHSTKKFKDIESFPNKVWYLTLQSIESFGDFK